MGTVGVDHKTGHIYLQQDISGELTKVLAGSNHGTLDTFLEHLFDLYTKASKTTQAVVVREDVAQRFTALQCETRFQTSDDLMKHLLHLHVEYLKTASNDIAKQTTPRERTNPRKSRKSQPKRNIKHTALTESDESCDLIVTDGNDEPWTDKSASNTVEPSSERKVDLSRVKDEVVDTDKAIKVEQSDKDADQGPLCLMQKGLLTPDSLTSNVHKYGFKGQNSIEYDRKIRQHSQSNWRNQSEPAYQQQKPGPLPFSSRRSRKAVYIQNEDSTTGAMDTSGDKQYSENSQDDGYNYVLNSLANSPGPDGPHGSLPASPMMVSAKYSKSISYTISSDEEEKPEDLSLSSGVVKSHPLISPHSQNSQVQVGGLKENNVVKYDSNANAVTVPMAQLPNGQFLSPTQITVPQNLIFHDQGSVAGNALVGQPQVLQLAQPDAQNVPVAHIVSSMSQTNPGSQPPPLYVAGLPRLQLVNVQGPPPPLVHHGTGVLQKPAMKSPKVSIPARSVSPPGDLNQQQGQVTSPDTSAQFSDGGSPTGSRRKRKRVEDTTIFRDPPEQSLPFNGPNKYRFYCDVCDTGFTRKYTFNRHKCKGRVEKHYCQLCDKAYLSKYKLKDHILVKHEGQTVSCPECGKRFSSRSSMEMHKKQQHEGQYSIFCKICGKGFNHTGHYYGHMNKHTNTKPFWCQQCGKRFYGSSYLHNHKQVCRGNNDLNYACTVCDRKFKCELYLKKHMKIHDNTPIIANPNVAKATDEDLTKAGVSVADTANMNGSVFPDTGKPVFPNALDVSDSNSSIDGLVVNEKDSTTEGSFMNDTNEEAVVDRIKPEAIGE